MTFVEGKEQSLLLQDYTMIVRKKAHTGAYAVELNYLALRQNLIQEQVGQAFGSQFQTT